MDISSTDFPPASPDSSYVKLQTSPSRKNLDEQICSGLGQTSVRVRKISNRSSPRRERERDYSFNSNGSIRIASGGGTIRRKDGGFMPTPRRGTTGLSPNKSGNITFRTSGSSSNPEELQGNDAEEELKENFNLAIRGYNHDPTQSSESPVRSNQIQVDNSVNESNLRRSTRNQSKTTSSTPPPPSNNTLLPTSFTPTTSPTRTHHTSQQQQTSNSPIKLKAKLTDGVSKPKSKNKKSPAFNQNGSYSSSTASHSNSELQASLGRGLGISMGLKRAMKSREEEETLRELQVNEMDREILEYEFEDSSFVFQDGNQTSQDGSWNQEGQGGEMEQESVKVHVR